MSDVSPESTAFLADPTRTEHKGVPETGLRLLADVSLPAAVLHEASLAHNLGWMQAFCDDHGALLAPHGKTTMAPALFRRQLESGAWAITLATAPQCRAAFAHGATRLLLANQLVGRANMAIVADLLEAGAELWCLVDSADNARELDAFFAGRGLRLPVLIERGVPGGRCGCRGREEVLALADVVHEAAGLELSGVEGYEGLVQAEAEASPEAAVAAYAADLVDTLTALQRAGRLAVARPLVTASGSAWHDIVAEAFRDAGLDGRVRRVMRPGCYVTHDHGLYGEAQARVLGRRPTLGEGLRPALEVVAQVQSLPEPGLAIVAMGRRDVGGDRLPLALRRYREGGTADRTLSVEGWRVEKLMDQHAFVRLPEVAGDRRVGDVRVGDIVAFGISHPCLTFDKWRRLCRVDASLAVVEVLETCF
ncbi:amino acid deaminase [Halomonas rhizosphaerae]|uniref:Amino acid deaminase n=1 Tax=Halomonas rhizosphaerae TaxID=3043296 RepID=A0ABT6UZ82_9GAMM|nr:amino acid deaminase [Halomonas rhizosphaerae]MDI5890017.1 amino acid deaminase [Halomonas rhizosphaerae]